MKKLGIISFLLILSLFVIIPLDYANAEPILISFSADRDRIVYDGKWTDVQEWKQSSLDKFAYTDGSSIILRTAHQGNFIYVLIDFVTDVSPDHVSDKALICIDGKNDKSEVPGNDDYCFGVALGQKAGFTLQGGSPLAVSNNFVKITNPKGFIGTSAVSDVNDRYSKIPHSSYEFRIPIDVFGRSDIYGFYFTVFDDSTGQFYSWPKINPEKPFKIPSPSLWGEIVSPDKSLPEFQWPLLALLPSMLIVIYLARIKNNLKLH